MISNTKYVTLHVMIHSVYKDTQAIRNSDLVVLPLTRPLRTPLPSGGTQERARKRRFAPVHATCVLLCNT